MAGYREEIQQDLFEKTGERNVMNLSFSRFEDKSKIVFDDGIRGSINLANGRMKTEEEAAQFIEEVSKLKLL
ncbi:MAG: hypothetical protein LBK18_06715 [Prevotellaceae bacterium]|jgi:hypothetical protein|nr:hypothetical protein [Prevotellaceae bacterium]